MWAREVSFNKWSQWSTVRISYLYSACTTYSTICIDVFSSVLTPFDSFFSLFVLSNKNRWEQDYNYRLACFSVRKIFFVLFSRIFLFHWIDREEDYDYCLNYLCVKKILFVLLTVTEINEMIDYWLVCFSVWKIWFVIYFFLFMRKIMVG